jgi:hypothetical protein
MKVSSVLFILVSTGATGKLLQRESCYLGNHHMAVKSALSLRACRPRDMGSNLGDHRGAKGHIRDEMAIHDIDMEPVSTIVNCGGAGSA